MSDFVKCFIFHGQIDFVGFNFCLLSFIQKEGAKYPHRRNASQDKNRQSSISEGAVGGVIGQCPRVRRKAILERPNYSLNLWSIMKNCIGKELSKIPMPVCVLF